MALGSKNERGFYHACGASSPDVNDLGDLMFKLQFAIIQYLSIDLGSRIKTSML
jgi:hypothetical protein